MTDSMKASVLPPDEAAIPAPPRKPRWPFWFVLSSCILAAIELFILPHVIADNIQRTLHREVRTLGYWVSSTSAAEFLLMILLLVAGIRLAQRRVAAGMLYRVFAVSMLSVEASNVCLAWLINRRGFSAAATVWLLWHCVQMFYPLLCLFWFSRKSIRRQMADWAEAAAPTGRPRWPKVLATISCSLAAILLLLSIYKFGYFAELIVRSRSHGEEMPYASSFGMFGVIANLILGSTLLGAGIRLALRRPDAAMLHRVFAAGMFTWSLGALIVNIEMFSRGLWSRENTDSYFIGLVSMVAYPVFLLIWFSRRRIRAQVQAWTRVPSTIPAHPGRWPKAIGLSSCLVASANLVGGIWLGSRLIKSVWHQLTWGIRPGWLDLASCVTGIFGLEVAIVLLFGGIQLARKKPVGWLFHVVYAVASLGGLIVLLTVDIWTTQAEDLERGFLAGWYTGNLIGLIYPTFCMIWFLRPRIRDQVEAWREESAMVGAVPRR
jgi:hypothetical protein